MYVCVRVCVGACVCARKSIDRLRLSKLTSEKNLFRKISAWAIILCLETDTVTEQRRHSRWSRPTSVAASPATTAFIAVSSFSAEGAYIPVVDTDHCGRII